MKNKIVIIFSFFFLNNGFSQEIAIPYRDGDLWGICNPEGKIIIVPKYDQIEISHEYSSNFEMLTPKIKSKIGLILNGKLLFDANYNNIYEKNGNFVLINEENNQKTTDIVSKVGTSILKTPILEIISHQDFSDRITAYHVLNKDFTESLFILDNEKNKIVQWIYENYFSITNLKKQSDIKSISFSVKKTENDALITEAWDFSKLPNEKVKAKLLYRTEQDYLKKFTEKTYKYESTENGYGVGTGRYSGGTDIKGDSDYDLVVEAPQEEYTNEKSKKTERFSTTFLIENNQLYIQKSNTNKPNEIFKKQLNIKAPIKDVSLQNCYFSIVKNDTIQILNNMVFYKKKDKQIVLFSDRKNDFIEYDTISKRVENIYTTDDKKEMIFLIGEKNKKTNLFKYSFFSNTKGLLFPIQYDELISKTNLYSTGSIATFITRIGNKFGMIKTNGQEVLKTEFDEINEFLEASRGRVGKLLRLKKDNKFGLIIQKVSDYSLEIINAVFDYEIKDVFINYPSFDFYKTNTTPKLNLLSLKDKNGKLIGYANPNGILYYKN